MTNDLLNSRQQLIVNILNVAGEVKISSLKEKFSVTEMTIRRDLEKLEQLGLARRTFGGAIPVEKDIALRERVDMMREEKIRIGKKAAELIQPGDSVFIDGGTTTVQIARNLPPGADIMVVTNALNVSAELLDKKIPTIVIGGNLIEATFSLAGPIAVRNLSEMAFDRVFLGATGCSVQHGFSNSNLLEAEVKKAAITLASEVNIVIDHTKFGEKVLFSFAPLQQIHRIITDQLPEEKLREACRIHDVDILLVDDSIS